MTDYFRDLPSGKTAVTLWFGSGQNQLEEQRAFMHCPENTRGHCQAAQDSLL